MDKQESYIKISVRDIAEIIYREAQILSSEACHRIAVVIKDKISKSNGGGIPCI